MARYRFYCAFPISQLFRHPLEQCEKIQTGRYSSQDGNVVRDAMPFPSPVTKQRRQKYKKISVPSDRVEYQISVGSHRAR
jgi:hypothetical protein